MRPIENSTDYGPDEHTDTIVVAPFFSCNFSLTAKTAKTIETGDSAETSENTLQSSKFGLLIPKVLLLSQSQILCGKSVARNKNPAEDRQTIFFFHFCSAPDIVEAITPAYINESAINVTWNEPKRRNGYIVNYTVMWQELGLPGPSAAVPENTTQTFYFLPNLSPYRRYNFSIAAWTEVGIGSYVSQVYETDESGLFSSSSFVPSLV